MRTVEIDGSIGEGGGAILRVALGLAVVTRQAVKILNIRKGRKEPGLRVQHLESVKAMAAVCNAEVKGVALGSTELEFYPGEVVAKPVQVQISTAGSIGLVFQSLAPLACQLQEPLLVEITGGATFGKFAPPVPYIQQVLLPALAFMDYRVELEVHQHGFFPVGGARITIRIFPCQKLRPVRLEKQPDGKIHGVSVASEQLKNAEVARRQAAAAKERLKGYDVEIGTEYVSAASAGSGIVLWRGFLGADGLGERGKPAEQVGREAADSLLSVLDSSAAVDRHLSDQLLVFMALANGRSSILAPELTRHAQTNMEIIKRFVAAEFRLQPKNNCILITCGGA